MSDPRKPGSAPTPEGAVAIISLGRPLRVASNDLPEDRGAGHAVLLCGLSPGGVCRAGAVSCTAVSSYLTISPLPLPGIPASRRSVFCGTFPVRGRTVGVAHHPALWSPDFPPTRGRRSPGGRTGERLAVSVVHARAPPCPIAGAAYVGPTLSCHACLCDARPSSFCPAVFSSRRSTCDPRWVCWTNAATRRRLRFPSPGRSSWSGAA